MKCPHCDAPMSEEQVFCESCGKERQLVPVFEAEIDETIEDAISGIAVDLANTQEIKPVHVEKDLHVDSDTDREYIEKKEQLNNKNEKSNFNATIKLMACGIGIVIILVVVIVLFFQNGNESSYDYQIKKAEEMYMSEDYEKMLKHAEKAMDIAPNSSDAKMLIARAYNGMGNRQYAREALEDLLAVDGAYVLAYDFLIPIYEEDKAYDKIADLLSKCNVQSVLDQYVNYLVDVPQPSETPGSYEESIVLKLIAPGKGDIYYTLDGSEPDEADNKYISPILLDAGHYTVNAMYVNDYQVSSEIVQFEYDISSKTLESPIVEPESGVYTEPQYISLTVSDENYQVYYTTDGSKPGLESFLYDAPIPMPLGMSKFAFVIYDENGMSGEVAYAEYTLDLQLPMTAEHAKNLLIVNAVSTRYLADANGHMPGIEGVSQFVINTVIDIEGQYYYLFDEIYTAPDGVSQKTDNHFAVHLQTGQCYRAVRSAAGTFQVLGM